jgi:hypothetical protein
MLPYSNGKYAAPVTVASKKNGLISPLEDRSHYTDTPGRLTAHSSVMHRFSVVQFAHLSVDSTINFKNSFLIPNNEIKKNSLSSYTHMQKLFTKFHRMIWIIIHCMQQS